MKNQKTTKAIKYILIVLGTLALCAVWFRVADAHDTDVHDTCVWAADMGDYAYWRCHGNACRAHCNDINPDAPDYCEHVCATLLTFSGVRS